MVRTTKAKEFGIDDARVHPGFRRATEEVYAQAKAAVQALHKQHEYEKFTILITGLSMGGAVATMLAARLRADDGFDVSDDARKGIKVFTMGQPKVGDQTFVKGLFKYFPELTRVTSVNDPIPNLPPPLPLFNYAHTPVELWLEAPVDKGGVSNFPSYICTGLSNKKCVGQFSWINGFRKGWPNNHLMYF